MKSFVSQLKCDGTSRMNTNIINKALSSSRMLRGIHTTLFVLVKPKWRRVCYWIAIFCASFQIVGCCLWRRGTHHLRRLSSILDLHILLSCDISLDKRCSTPLSPISREVIEEMCAAEMERTKVNAQSTRSAPLAIFPAHRKDNVARESFGVESASHSPREHSGSRGYGSLNAGGGQVLRSPARPSLKPFLEVGQVVKRICRSSATTTQSHRLVPRLLFISEIDPCIRNDLTDAATNEEDLTVQEQPRSLRPTRSLSAMLPARLTSSQRVETPLGRQNDKSRSYNVAIPTSPLVNNCLSPITHFPLPEPFNDSADSTLAATSPKKHTFPIGRITGRNYVESDSTHLTFVFALSLKFSETSCTHVRLPSASRVSSPLTGNRQLPLLNPSAQGYRLSSLRAEYTEDNSSSDLETGPDVNDVPARISEYSQVERASDATQAWIGSGSHERRPHTRPVSRGSSVQMRSVHATAPLWSTRQSPIDVKEGVDDWFVAVFKAMPTIDHLLAGLHRRHSVSIIILRHRTLVISEIKVTAMLSSLDCATRQRENSRRSCQLGPRIVPKVKGRRISNPLAHAS